MREVEFGNFFESLRCSLMMSSGKVGIFILTHCKLKTID